MWIKVRIQLEEEKIKKEIENNCKRAKKCRVWEKNICQKVKSVLKLDKKLNFLGFKFENWRKTEINQIKCKCFISNKYLTKIY